MKTYKKELNGLAMSAYNDSNVEWAISSVDSDGFKRTHFYSKKAFTLKDAFQFHADLYCNS